MRRAWTSTICLNSDSITIFEKSLHWYYLEIPTNDKCKIFLFWVSLFQYPIIFFHLFGSSSIMISPNIKRFWRYLLTSHMCFLLLCRNLTDIDELVKVIRCKDFHSSSCWEHSSWKNIFLHHRVFLRADAELAKDVQVFIYKADYINTWKNYSDNFRN